MKQKLLIAIAIAKKPEIFIFDEPTAKLTAEEVKQLFKIIKDLKKSGVAVVYISHNLKEIFEICDIVTVLRDGEKVITNLKRISKPGLRVYVKSGEVPKVLNGLGTAVISTSEGVVTDKTARAKNIGGEVLAYVW